MKIKEKMNNSGNIDIKPIQAGITEMDYHINPKLKRDMEGIIATLQEIENFGTKMGNRNYIFTGPPGTGKSLGALYLASTLGFPVYDGKMVMNAQNISSMFMQLREQAKSNKIILLINEIDKFSSRDDVVDPNQQQTLNQLLDEMDGIDSNNGIFVFGTTNRPNSIDSSLRRPERFSKELEFMPPDRDGRLAILKIHAYGKGGHKFQGTDEDLDHAADVTFGYTGADLVGLLNEAFTNAILDDRTLVEQKDFEYALKVTKPSALRDMPFREPKIKFEDMGGYTGHKELLRRVVANSNGSMLLFYGPKGTGKTRFGEAIAGEYGFNYIVVSGSEPEDKFVGETGKAIDKYLDRAKQLAPCVLLFDEIDSLVEKKGIRSHKSSWSGLLQSRLSQPIEGVYVLGTVNRPDMLNGTFRDRFVHKLYFGMPSAAEQEDIWNIYLPEEMDAKALVSVNDKLSCRDIERTHKMIIDYGIKPEVEVYKHLIESIKQEKDVDYNTLRDLIGDSVRDYTRIKEFIGENK